MSDEHTTKLLALFEPEELAQLAERARLDAHSGVKGEPHEPHEDPDVEDAAAEAAMARSFARLSRGLAGLRCTANMYGAARDPKGLRSVVWAAWAVESTGFETRHGPDETIAGAVESVGARVFEVPGLAERLAGSRLQRVRLALAVALPPGGQSDPILRLLAGDADPQVRAAAREKIASDDPWGGAFPISPEGHPQEVLEAAHAVLELPGYRVGKAVQEAVDAFAPLSDPLAVACWERLLSHEYIGNDALQTWFPCLLERPGSGGALVRLVALYRQRGHAFFITSALKEVELAREVRQRAFSELLAGLRDLEREDRMSESAAEMRSPRHELANIAAVIAPEDGDGGALLETILGSSIDAASTPEPEGANDHHMHYMCSILSKILAGWTLDGALREALVEARRADQPGRWARVGPQLWNTLGRDPVLRERARRALDEGDENARSEAVSALLGTHFDPDEDGTREEVANALYDRPELRAAVIWRARSLILPRAREDLEHGRLALDEALAVLSGTPAGEQSDAMWDAVRALRAEQLAGDDEMRRRALKAPAALIRAGDGWEPSDLAYAREVSEQALRIEENDQLLADLILALERIDAPESALLMEEIEARATSLALQGRFENGRKFSKAMRELSAW